MSRFARLHRSSQPTFLIFLFSLVLGFGLGAPTVAEPPAALPGLQNPAGIVWDSDGIPHVYTGNDLDAIFLQGYLHAQDRLFWMDNFRRTFEGTLAELVGAAALPTDLQFRKFNLRAAAQLSFDASSEETRRFLSAYAAGVNAFLATRPTPQEYGLLEIETVRPWHPTDPILMLKGFSALFWVGLEDIQRTLDLAGFAAQGAVAGFDGSALFLEDIYRVAPVLPAVVLPDFLESIGASDGAFTVDFRHKAAAEGPLDPEVLDLARDYSQLLAELPIFAKTRKDLKEGLGSNWWVVSGDFSESGNALMASDPHQPITMPGVLYQTHLTSRGRGGLEVTGTAFPGIPGIQVGCNRDVCWAPTNTNIDAGDVFLEELIFDPTSGAPTHTIFQGEPEPIVRLPQQFRVNQAGDGVADHLTVATVDPLVGDLFLVPRRANGPLLTFSRTTGSGGFGLASQYVGWGVAQDLEAYRRLMYVRNVDEFMEAVSYLDNFTFNMGYADRRGHIAYAIGGEVPLRQDLQLQGQVDGQPPIMIRDGTGVLAHQWLDDPSPTGNQSAPYQILPRAEMPHAVDPPEGFIVTANNDPIGTSLDNNVFNQYRADGGILYLHYDYFSLRSARIESELRRLTQNGGKVSVEELRDLQANTQLMDAEVILPSLLEAYHNATMPAAPAVLASLAEDTRIQEAIERLAAWDYSTPTGIEQGYDPGDDPDNLQPPDGEQIAQSVAATLYSVWRGQAVRRVIDETLLRIGLGGSLPDSQTAFRAFANQILNFGSLQGQGVSGVDFFAVDGVTDRRAARDVVLLESLKEALDLLAGDAFAAAFDHSTDQTDYRWGRLHRITIPHVLAPTFNVPNAGGFQDLEPTLPGVARGGGLETVNTGSHDHRAADADSFVFAVTPGYRLVAEMTRRGPRGVHIVPGGSGANPSDPHYSNQLGRYLTNRYTPLRFTTGEVNQDAESLDIFLPGR